MAGVRFTELQSRPTAFLDFTSVTLDEFRQLVPPFEAAFHARMAVWRMDGKPCTARRFTVYKTCPLPTPEDRLLFILTYLKAYALQVVRGDHGAWAWGTTVCPSRHERGIRAQGHGHPWGGALEKDTDHV